MVKQRQVMTNNNNKRKPRARARNQRANQVGTLAGRFGIPTRFPIPGTDVVPANLRVTFDLANTATGACNVSLAYGVGATSGATLYLDDLCSGFKALATCYSRFLIKRLQLTVRLTTPSTLGGYGIANFEAIPSGVPSSLADVSNARHTCEASVLTPGTFTVTPTDYYNEWRSTGGDGDLTNDGRMGSSQISISNQAAINAQAAIVTLDMEMVFCGYRQ